jgi:opacity protein-like surface antigen
LTASLAATGVHANGIYLGGGVGSAMSQDSAGNSSGTQFDESDTAWKAFGGYRFDALPIIRLSGEIGYRDLGKPTASVGGVPLEYKLTGFDYSALAGVGLGPVEVYARLGGMQYDLKKRIGAAENKFTGSAPLYGAGLQFMLFGIGVRAEYEKVDIKELDSVDMVTVSAFYKF